MTKKDEIMKPFRIKYIEEGKLFTVVAKGRNADELMSIFQRTFPDAKIIEVERAY